MLHKKLVALILFSFLCSPFANGAKMKEKYYLSIMAIFQNEANYLEEWIDYHLMLGVDHFYLYNHNSEDHFLTVLTPYIKKGIIEYFDFSGPGHPQNEAILDALKRAKMKSKWLGIIDIDEFFLPKQHDNLKDFLKNYEKYAGVSINWQCFGTSHVASIPKGELMIEHLTFKAPSDFSWNRHVKCIVRPEKVTDVVNTHCFIYKKNYFCVRPNKAVQGHSHESDIQTDRIVLNHYWTKDEEFFNTIKVPRCLSLKNWSPETTQSFKPMMNEIQDLTLVDKYVDRLKKFNKHANHSRE